MKKKLLANMSTSVLAQLVAVISGFVLPRLILQQFGSEVNGLTQSIKQFLGIISFLDLGVGQVVRSALYGPLQKKDQEKISSIMASGGKFYRHIAYALAVYVGLLMIGYPWLLSRDLGWAFTAALIGAMAISSFAQYYFGIINEQLLHADQRGYVIYSLQIVTTLLNLLMCIWIIRMGGSIQEVKLVTSVCYLLKPVVICFYIKKRYSINKKIRYSGEPIAQKWNGIAQHVSAVVLESTDSIVLTLFSTLSNVSVYSVYYMVIYSVQQFYQAATAGIQSAVGALWAKQDREALHSMFSWLEMGMHFATVFLFSCVGILIVPFVRVYTSGLTDADYIQPLFAFVLVLAYAVRCLRTPYNILILAGGHYKQTQKCHVAAAVLNLTISVAAVAAWGLVGIAVGTLAALAYQTGWMMIYDSRNLLCWPLGKMIKQIGVDLLTAALIVLACWRIEMHEISYFAWFVMAVQVAVIALAITAAMAAVFYRREFARLLRRIARGRLHKKG